MTRYLSPLSAGLVLQILGDRRPRNLATVCLSRSVLPVEVLVGDGVDAGMALDLDEEAILDADPAHVEAKGAVTQIAFLQRATAQSPDAVAASDAAPDDIDLAFAAADVQLFQRDIHGAFNRLIALVKKTAGDDRTRVRTRLISLFELFDAADPEVIAGRRNLANALY